MASSSQTVAGFPGKAPSSQLGPWKGGARGRCTWEPWFWCQPYQPWHGVLGGGFMLLTNNKYHNGCLLTNIHKNLISRFNQDTGWLSNLYHVYLIMKLWIWQMKNPLCVWPRHMYNRQRCGFEWPKIVLLIHLDYIWLVTWGHIMSFCLSCLKQ